MGDIIVTALGFVIIILVSYLFKKFGIFKADDRKFLSNMLININLPCVIINGFKDFQFEPAFGIAIALGLIINLVAVAVGYFVSMKKEDDAKKLQMMTCGGYNIGIFTVPFVSSFLSSTAVVSALMFDIGNAIVVFGTSAAIVTALVNKEKTNPVPAILKKIGTTPAFILYGVMIVVSIVGIQLPEPVFTIAAMGSESTAFLAMVLIGIMLEFKMEKSEIKFILSSLITRYTFSIIMAVLIYMFLPFDLEIRKALVISVFAPLATAGVVFASKIGCKPSHLGVFSSFSIVISMISIIAIVIFL